MDAAGGEPPPTPMTPHLSSYHTMQPPDPAKTATQAEALEKARAARTGPGRVGTRLRREADSSFAVDKQKGRSNTEFITYLNDGPIIWKSQLQPTVADSPNVAEYIALHEVAVSSVGLHNLVNEVGIKIEDTCELFEDNDGARRLTMSGMGQKKARHVQTKHHYIQELCREGRVKVLRVSTTSLQTC